jgi:hypothetical protein
MRFYSKTPTWRKWFAWYPVPIDGARVWLETVERLDSDWRVYFRDQGSTDSVETATDQGNYRSFGD